MPKKIDPEMLQFQADLLEAVRDMKAARVGMSQSQFATLLGCLCERFKTGSRAVLNLPAPRKP